MVTQGIDAVFRALADPTRRQILEMLEAGEAPVRAIADRFPMSRPAISKHLRLLREAGLLEEERRGRQRVHLRVPGALDAVERWLGWMRAGALGGSAEESAEEPPVGVGREATAPLESFGPTPGEEPKPRQDDWKTW